ATWYNTFRRQPGGPHPCANILCTAHNLNELACACIYFAAGEFIGIWMFLTLNNTYDFHIFIFSCEINNFLNSTKLCVDSLNYFIDGRQFEINILFDYVEADFHCFFSEEYVMPSG